MALEGPVDSARVATLVWPQARNALNNLRQRVHRLRKTTGARLVEMDESIRLASDLSLAQVARQAEDAALEADPLAWDGELLAGCGDDCSAEFGAWLESVRRRSAERRCDALGRIASAAESRGEIVHALRYAQRLVAEEPLSEYAHRRLMRLHHLRGDRAAALAAFEHCERVLKDEFGVKPGAETLALLRVVEQSLALPGVTAPRPLLQAGLLRPPRTVGRAQPWRRLLQAHDEGLIAVLVGEAGIGKTRLLQDFIATHPQAVYLQARPSDASVPYGALARLLRGVVAAVPAALGTADRPRLSRVVVEFGDAAPTVTAPVTQLQEAVESVLARAASEGFATLIIDDLHFADRASIEMLRSLVDAPALSGVRWLIAQRPIDAGAEDAALLKALADAPQVRWITLAPLGADDLAELVDSLNLTPAQPQDLVTALARHAGGNPLYVIETLRAMVAAPRADAALPRPDSIGHLLDRRLQRLSRQALALARIAAVAVPDFSIALAEQALGTTAIVLADAWQELEAADVLRGEAFAHDLVHDAVLRATPATIATHAHRQVAGWLAQRGAEPARVARHWLAGGEGRQAGAAFRDAAARALAAGRAREQAQLLEAAAEGFRLGGDPAAQVRAQVDAVGARVHCDGADAGLALVDRLLAETRAAADAAPLHCARATALLWAGRAADAEDAARRALEGTRADDLALQVGATRNLAQARAMGGDVAGGVALLQPLAARAEALPEIAERVQFFGDYTNLLMQAGRPVQAIVAATRHVELARDAHDAGEEVAALMNLFALRLRRGDATLALELAQRADRLLASPDQARMLSAWNSTHLGIVLCGLGRYAEGLAAFEAAREGLAAHANPRQVAMNDNRMAEAMLLLGQTARAHRLTAGGDAALPPKARAARLAARAMVERTLGHDDEALWREVAALVHDDVSHYERIIAATELLRFEPDPQRALDDAAVLQQQASELEYLPLALAAAGRRLSLLAQRGRSDDVARLAPWVEAQTHALAGPKVHLPQGLLDCALAWRAIGQPADAERCIADAMRWIYETALPNVPPWFQDSFLNRNECHRRVRAEAARRGRTLQGERAP